MLSKNNFLRFCTNKSNDFLKLKGRKYFPALLSTVFFFAGLMLFVLAINISGNEGNKNSADMNLRSSGRVNPSTLGMELDIPLGGYSGRGISIPINLSYSSKVWRLKHGGIHAEPGGNEPSGCQANYEAYFSEEAAAGWTTSMAVPYVEYTGATTNYNLDGEPDSGSSEDCVTLEGGGSGGYYYIKRIMVHLPGGETHELRADDSAFIADGNNPANWNGVYYAVDGSNIKYIEDSTTNPPTYRLQMPDGSFYDFGSSIQELWRRKAIRFTDRNGNFTSYFAPGSVDEYGVTHQNGYWKDTLSRNISVPIGLKAPTAPTTAEAPQKYKMPGMTGEYKLHWKRLNGGTQEESALTDINNPNYQLKHDGDTYLCTVNGIAKYCKHPAGSYLFSTEGRVADTGLFNPVVLSEIELPTGQRYKFTYDVYGRIEKIIYPTGGEEVFEYKRVLTLEKSDDSDANQITNFGVKKRRVYQTTGQGTPYEWNYESFYTAPYGYAVRTTNPDGTKNERFLHRGRNGGTETRFGYDSALAGMPYEERGFDDAGKLVSRKLTYWTKSVYPVNPGNLLIAERQPRVAQEKSFIYDASGNGVSATATYDYEGNIETDKSLPVLQKKATQYAFETTSGGSSITPFTAPCSPSVELCQTALQIQSPPPMSTPSSAKLRIAETTYLINDPAYPEWVQNIYKAQNMIGLVSTSVIKDGAETIVSRSEMKYDDASSSPNIGRGNPTALRVWDNMRGNWDNPEAYITTSAKFDQWGNQYETTDARGNTTTTTFDSTYHAYPIQVTSAIPDPNGTHGSNTPFITSATFDPVTGLPLTTTDANGLESRIEYDWNTLRPLRTKTYFNNQQVGSEAETIYHDQANNYWVKNRVLIDTNKWAESITYFDGLGRAYKAEEVNSEGNIFVEKEFDAEGRVKRVTNPFRANETKQWTTNVYDNASRIKEVHLPDGAKVITDYGVSTNGIIGVTKQITDQAGKKRKGISDALGRMIRVIEDPDNSNLNTDYVFDTLGNLRKTIQGEQSRYFTYDSLGRLLYAKQPEQEANTSFSFTDPITNNSAWSVKYEYDDNGNITKTTDARGVYVQGVYDNLNRLKKRDYSDTTPDVDFYYDGRGLPAIPNFSKGKTTRVASSVSETRYTSFDNLGRLLTHQQITDGQTYQTSYQYNLSGALVQETYPSNRTVSYNLDQDGDLESVWGQKPNNSSKLYLDQIKYNSAGAIERMRLGNGRWESAVYNSRQQITQIGLGYSDTDKSLLKLDYDYGTNTQNNGSLIQQKISFRGLTSEIKQAYIYDNLNRLKSSTETVGNQVSWKQTFDYDRYGNRSFDSANTTTINQSVSWKATNPLINTGDNRLKKDQDGDTITDYEYDKAGNLTLDAENRRFVFDAENRMKEFFHGTNTSNTPDAVYSYDGEGRRVRKVSGNRIVIFVYNSSGSLVAEYDSQLAQNPQVNHLTADHLGSPRVITDGRGAVISRHDYMAFGSDITETIGNVGGRTTAQGFNSADEVRKQYTGYERDDESGLDFAQARYYNSNHGRFTSVDPLTASATIRNPQTFNRYSYVLNSPYKFTDPLGLITSSTGACGSWCRNSDGGSSGPVSQYQAFENSTMDAARTPRWGTISRQNQTRQNEPPVITAKVNGVTYTGELVSSNVIKDDKNTGAVKVILNYSWFTEHKDDNGNQTRVAASKDVGDILNDGLSRMASNNLNAYNSEYNLSKVSKTSLTLQGSGSLGTKYKTAMLTGGEFGASVTFEFNNLEAIRDETRRANDDIQLQMVIDVGEKSMITAWSGGKVVKVGDQMTTSGVTLPSQFAQIARDQANSYAQRKYSEAFPERLQIWLPNL